MVAARIQRFVTVTVWPREQRSFAATKTYPSPLGKSAKGMRQGALGPMPVTSLAPRAVSKMAKPGAGGVGPVGPPLSPNPSLSQPVVPDAAPTKSASAAIRNLGEYRSIGETYDARSGQPARC